MLYVCHRSSIDKEYYVRALSLVCLRFSCQYCLSAVNCWSIRRISTLAMIYVRALSLVGLRLSCQWCMSAFGPWSIRSIFTSVMLYVRVFLWHVLGCLVDAVCLPSVLGCPFLVLVCRPSISLGTCPCLSIDRRFLLLLYCTVNVCWRNKWWSMAEPKNPYCLNKLKSEYYEH
jgi:hypothetical protein